MPARRTALLILITALVAAAPGAAHAAGLTEGPRLAAIYDDILAARFDRARTRLTTACPPAPREACLTLGVAVTWWQIVLDLENRQFDRQLETETATALQAAEAWTRREPQRAEAWFYLAAAHAPLVQLRVFRGQRLAAARDGNRIRESLERARALEPSLHDAQFGIGLYHYYADVAPAAARVLRMLLLLPGGDRRQGLREMLEARNRGELLRGEADYQLHWLYLWYEDQPQRALDLLKGLDARYPTNPVFLQRVAEVEDDYFHDHPASAASWRMLLARAQSGSSSASMLATVRARLGLAVQLDAMHETDRAIEQLRSVIAQRPTAPLHAHARAQVLLGAALDRLGLRDEALAAYRTALTLTSTGDTGAGSDLRARARRGLRERPDATAAQAYRLSLEGWRALEAGETTRAMPLLARARTLAAGDPVIAYRFARGSIAIGDIARARSELERVVQTMKDVPAVILAAACVDLATVYERSHDRSQAIALYERARSIVGSDPRTRAAAEEGLTRVVR